MTAYRYKALDKNGKEQSGVREGDSERQIRQGLRDQKLLPLSVEAVQGKSTFKLGKGTTKQPAHSLSTTELALLTRQLSTLLSAGLPMEEVIKGVAEQTEKPKIKSMLLAVRAKVLEGHPLATGLAEFPKAFSELYRSTVAAGEASGHLDAILLRLADHTEKQQRLQQKIRQALIYPGVMTAVSILIVTFLLVYVVPKMVAVFSESGQQLPLATEVLIAISDGLAHYGLWLLLALILSGFAIRRLLRRPKLKYRAHQWLLILPILGNTIRVINTARFARTFGILSSAGVPVLEAMRVGARLVTNLPIREAIDTATTKVREGASIHRTLQQTGYFSPMSIHLIASGEATGQLEKMLERAADNQEHDVSVLLDSLLTLFEPAIIVIMGAIVLFIVMAIMLPIFNLNQFNG